MYVHIYHIGRKSWVQNSFICGDTRIIFFKRALKQEEDQAIITNIYVIIYFSAE